MASSKKVGRPPWEPDKDTLDRVLSWSSAGVDQKDMASALGIGYSTFEAKLNEFPELRDAVKSGRQRANMAVQSALFLEATSGNTTAAIFWMKCRAGWRDSSADEIRKAELALKREEMERRVAADGGSDEAEGDDYDPGDVSTEDLQGEIAAAIGSEPAVQEEPEAS